MHLGLGLFIDIEPQRDEGSGTSAFTIGLSTTGTGSIFDPTFASLSPTMWVDSVLSANTQSGGLVSQWNDLTANANNLTAAGTARPTYTANGLNNTAELLFDGVANVMTKTFTLNNPMSLFIVFASVTYGTGGVHDILLDGNAAGKMAVGSLTSSSTAISSGAGLSDAHAIPNGTLTRLIGIYGISGTLTYVDSTGTDRTVMGSTGTNNADGLILGCLGNLSRFYNAKIKEVALFPGSLTAGDISNLKTYAKLKHSLAA